jgi:hypothetical protein
MKSQRDEKLLSQKRSSIENDYKKERRGEVWKEGDEKARKK